MKIRNLFEEWEKYVTVDATNKTYPIYRNPTLKDYIHMRKEENTNSVRYILKLYGAPVLYIFDSEVLHYFAALELGIEYGSRIHLPVWGDYSFGESSIENNSLSLNSGILIEIKRMGRRAPFDFLKRFFNNAPEPRKKLFKI